MAQLLGQEWKRRDADAAAHEQRPFDVEPVPVPERPEDRDGIAGFAGTEGLRTRPDGIDQKGELARRRETDAHRPRQQPAGRLEHEELARNPRLEPAARDAEERVRPYGLSGSNR